MALLSAGIVLACFGAGLALADVHNDSMYCAGAAEDEGTKGCGDLASFLQGVQPISLRGAVKAQEPAPTRCEPFLITLRRESVPIYRRGKVASFKTSYSGVLNVGTPAQEFRVVFDTGSGNIVLPAAECKSEACLVEDRRRFNMTSSDTAVPINKDGSTVEADEESDQATIGFGTGEITGEFTRDRVCFGSPPKQAQIEGVDAAPPAFGGLAALIGLQEREVCVEMNVILAFEMSTQPFKTFRFDGILGLGLGSSALTKQFSAFEAILGAGMPAAHFGVFLSEGEDGEESQIAMGGIDERRLLEPLSWAPVSMPEYGYWQVPILAVRVDGQLLDICEDGTCRGVADTGTSHLGIPAPYDKEISELLTRDAGDTLDCRLIQGAEVQIELPGYNLTLHPANYMRRLPLREGVSVGSAQGVTDGASKTDVASTPSPSSEPAGQQIIAATATSEAAGADGDEALARRFCSPRFMGVRLPAPLGPKLFILGEPVLHRYYTVYDWANERVGFSLANNRRNTMKEKDVDVTDRRGVLPAEVDMLLLQERVSVQLAADKSADAAAHEEEVAFVQESLEVSVRSRRK